MRLFLLLVAFIFSISCVYAQDIEGVEINTKKTQEQVIAKFGKPDRLEINDADWPEGSKIRYYHYGKNHIVFTDYEGLIEFGVVDNRFAIIKNYINGGIKVGDPLSKIQNLNIHGPLKLRRRAEDGTLTYNLFTENDDLLRILVKNGKITYIGISVSM